MTTNPSINSKVTADSAVLPFNTLNGPPDLQNIPEAFLSAMKEAAENKAKATGSVNKQLAQPRVPIGTFLAVTKGAVLEKNQPSKFGTNDKITLTLDICVGNEVVPLRTSYWVARAEDSVFCRHLFPLLGRDPRTGFQIAELTNVTCIVSITHFTNEKGTYSNVEAIEKVTMNPNQSMKL